MDCSNPVKDSTRCSIKEMLEQTSAVRRQDLAYLKLMAGTARREIFPGMVAREVGGEVLKQEFNQLMEALDLNVDFASGLDPSEYLEEVADSWPVCGLMYQGKPIHPPGVNQKGGAVCVNRSFGGFSRDKTWVRELLQYFSADELLPYFKETVYTRGTACGFNVRLREQTTRKCVSVVKSFGSRKMVMKTLRKVLPVDVQQLKDWGSNLIDLIEDIEMSKVSSAGAPYWKPKQPEGLEQALEVVLPELYNALTEGTVTELMARQPELFLVAANNKTDRYKVEKLADKTRPYFQFPVHWQMLFSVLSQSFTHALKLFSEDDRSFNAYGSSWARGGGSRLCERAKKLKKIGTDGGRPWVAVYGDDADVYYRDKDGRLVRICPDFRQMDGSVDRDIVDITIQYVLECFQKRFPNEGARSFWTEVGRWWGEFATNPHIIVQGTKIYQKRQRDGLLSGVVGTTLFDTAKAAVSYDLFFTEVHDRKQYHLLEEKHAVAFFRGLGLEIKEGTWRPEFVHEDPAPGILWSNQKFLGVHHVWAEGPNKMELVPYLEADDWMELLASPRDDPDTRIKAGGGFGVRSLTSNLRTRFDRMRGYLVTGAFSNPAVQPLLYSVINEIPGEVILMSVQAGGGKGEPPEMHTVCGGSDEFQWPGSDGVPSPRWCYNLYFSEDNQYPEEEAPWLKVFPDLGDAIAEYRRKWCRYVPRMRVVEAVKGTPFEKGAEVLTAELEVVLETPENPLLPKPVPWEERMELAPTYSTPSKGQAEVVNPRSEILNISYNDQGERQAESKKRLPTLVELAREMFKSVRVLADSPGSSAHRTFGLPGGFVGDDGVVRSYSSVNMHGFPEGVDIWRTQVITLEEFSSGLGVEPRQAVEVAKKAGLLVFGSFQERFVSRIPIQTSTPSAAKAQEKAMDEVKAQAGFGGPGVPKFIKAQADRFMQQPASEPKQVLKTEMDVQLRRPKKAYSGTAEYLSQAFSVLQSNLWFPALQTRQLSDGQVEVRLTLRRENSESQTWLSLVAPSVAVAKNQISEYVLSLIGGPLVEPVPHLPNKEKVQRRIDRALQQVDPNFNFVRAAVEEKGAHLPTAAGFPPLTVPREPKTLMEDKGKKLVTMAEVVKRPRPELDPKSEKFDWSAEVEDSYAYMSLRGRKIWAVDRKLRQKWLVRPQEVPELKDWVPVVPKERESLGQFMLRSKFGMSAHLGAPKLLSFTLPPTKPTPPPLQSYKEPQNAKQGKSSQKYTGAVKRKPQPETRQITKRRGK